MRGATHDLAPANSVQSAITKDEERVIFEIRPTMIFIIVRYIIAILVMLVLVVVATTLGSNFEYASIIALVLSLLILLNPIYHHILRQREIYTLTNHKIEFTYGLLGRTTRNIPLAKIQDVTATATPLERLLGIGDIVIDSAAEMGKIPLRKVSNPKALTDIILREMRERS
ncbi:MAG: PH domain-containing protein [Acidobacteriota bacterium]